MSVQKKSRSILKDKGKSQILIHQQKFDETYEEVDKNLSFESKKIYNTINLREQDNKLLKAQKREK